MIHILGSGVTALVIAACLDYLNKDFVIESKSESYVPNLLLLRYDNIEERNLYFSIFRLDISKLHDYCRHVKVGYFYDNCIHDSCSEKARRTYLKKQHRTLASSSMSDGLSSFDAIRLDKIYDVLLKRYQDKIRNEYSFNEDDKIYDTIGMTLQLNSTQYDLEYIAYESNDISDYDFVYDCSNSLIKRYTASTTEYLTNQPLKQTTAIKNYYAEPNVITFCNITLIGRTATKTQMKQKDVIKYILQEETK